MSSSKPCDRVEKTLCTSYESAWTDLAIWMHRRRRRSRRLLLLLLLEVVSAAAAAPIDVGAQKSTAVLMVVLAVVVRRHPEPAVKVLSILKYIELI